MKDIANAETPKTPKKKIAPILKPQGRQVPKTKKEKKPLTKALSQSHSSQCPNCHGEKHFVVKYMQDFIRDLLMPLNKLVDEGYLNFPVCVCPEYQGLL